MHSLDIIFNSKVAVHSGVNESSFVEFWSNITTKKSSDAFAAEYLSISSSRGRRESILIVPFLSLLSSISLLVMRTEEQMPPELHSFSFRVSKTRVVAAESLSLSANHVAPTNSAILSTLSHHRTEVSY